MIIILYSQLQDWQDKRGFTVVAKRIYSIHNSWFINIRAHSAVHSASLPSSLFKTTILFSVQQRALQRYFCITIILPPSPNNQPLLSSSYLKSTAHCFAKCQRSFHQKIPRNESAESWWRCGHIYFHCGISTEGLKAKPGGVSTSKANP